MGRPEAQELLRDCVDRHEGRPAIILGGGPSCPSDLEQIGQEHRKRAVFFGINQHGHKLTRVDYVCALDRLQKFGESLWDHGAVVSTQNDADILVTQKPKLPFSGHLGMWVAHVMGCEPILLCGMDCYAGPTYFHAPEAHSSGTRMTVEAHQRRWRNVSNHTGRHHIRAISGPLLEVFDAYDPNETEFIPEMPKEPEVMVHKVTGVRVVVRRPVIIQGESYRPQQVVEIDEHIARELIRMKKVAPYTERPKRGGRKRKRSTGNADRLRSGRSGQRPDREGDSRHGVPADDGGGARHSGGGADVPLPDGGSADDHERDDDAVRE